MEAGWVSGTPPRRRPHPSLSLTPTLEEACPPPPPHSLIFPSRKLPCTPTPPRSHSTVFPFVFSQAQHHGMCISCLLCSPHPRDLLKGRTPRSSFPTPVSGPGPGTRTAGDEDLGGPPRPVSEWGLVSQRKPHCCCLHLSPRAAPREARGDSCERDSRARQTRVPTSVLLLVCCGTRGTLGPL